MQFPFKLLWLVLSVTLPESVAADNPQRSYKAKRLPDFDKRHTFWKAHARPNILFILTDDQDLHMNSLDRTVMPAVNKFLIEEGTFYKRHFCTVALCCPSRVSLLTGKAAHNTNVTDISPPYGGYPKFLSQGLNEDYLPLWLQAAGYNTYYTGKLMNAYGGPYCNQTYPKGFNSSSFLLDPYTYEYFNSSWAINGSPPIQYPGNHTTDITLQKSLGLLDEAVKAGDPFFLGIAPIGPHANMHFSDPSAACLSGLAAKEAIIAAFSKPQPQSKYQDSFSGAQVPRTPNFNPNISSGAAYIRNLPIQNQSNIDYNDGFHRARLQVLAGLDDMVDELIRALDSHGILDNTFIIYTTDNGFHIGQHRLQPGKSCPYDTDINIPLIIRGPGVPRNKTTNIVTTHTDLAPTFFEISGIPLRSDFDGIPIPLTAREISMAAHNRAEHVNVEYWGFADITEGAYGLLPGLGANSHYSTYKAVRVYGKGYNLLYTVWCTNERELYDLNSDPYQMTNLLLNSTYNITGISTASPTILGYSISALTARLDALLLVLKSCKASTCYDPWLELHPWGDVTSLPEAMNPKFDDFYEKQQPKVTFLECELGYLIDAEGPQQAFSYQGLVREGVHWSEFV